MDVLTAIKTRRSVRSFLPKSIPAKVQDRMRQALRYAPSACNFQPWRFIFVTDDELRQGIARASFEQLWIAEAPIIVVGCAIPGKAYKTMGGYGNSADMDVAIALDHLTLAAVADGLGTCWIGAFEEDAVKRLLRVPKTVKVVALTPLGYPAAPEGNAPIKNGDRKAPDEVFSTNGYRRG